MKQTDAKKKEYETINAIEWMKQGSSMLKYGRFGYPHFRHFELSEDGQSLQWYSSSKKLQKSRIDLREVLMLQKGQLTDTFKKHLQPRLASCSFSLIYANGSKTLDVITKNKNAYLIWTKGLEAIIEYNQTIKQRDYGLPRMVNKNDENKDIEFPQNIMIKVLKRDEESIAKRLALQPQPPKKLVQRELEIAIKRFKKLTFTCNDIKYSNINEMDVIKKRLVDLEQDMEKIKNSFQTKSLNVASHEIWRTSVELKALDNKIQAIVKSYKS